MTEERRDNSIFVLGLLIAAALAFYGLWTEGNPTVVELVEQIKKRSIEYLPAEPITRIDKQVIYMTATPAPSIDTIIYGTPLPQLAVLDSADVVSTLRALTPVPPTTTPMPTEIVIEVPTIALVSTQVVEQMPTAAPAPPEVLSQVPIVVPEPPTVWPTEPLPVIPTNTPVPPTIAPINTPLPPTIASINTPLPPTVIPTNTPLPPTVIPTNTPLPPTVAPTHTSVPTIPPATPTSPATLKALTPVVPTVVGAELVEVNPPEVTESRGMATLQGHIDFINESTLTLILTDGDYYNGFEVARDGQFWFENVPNGTYNLSVAGQSGCGQIEVSVPDGHATLTYNYRFYKMQCALLP